VNGRVDNPWCVIGSGCEFLEGCFAGDLLRGVQELEGHDAPVDVIIPGEISSLSMMAVSVKRTNSVSLRSS
jgi:hypothetical protein